MIKALAVVLFMIGFAMVVHSVYDQKYTALRASSEHVKYKFIPRSVYDEQTLGTSLPISEVMQSFFRGGDLSFSKF